MSYQSHTYIKHSATPREVDDKWSFNIERKYTQKVSGQYVLWATIYNLVTVELHACDIHPIN